MHYLDNNCRDNVRGGDGVRVDYEGEMSAVQHSYPEPVKTVHGDGLLIGVDGRGNACVCFLPGDAPELEKAHWLGGPNYACMIPEEDVIRVS